MSIGTWIIVGLFAGFLTSKFIIRSGDGLVRDLGLGIAGAVIGGWFARTFSTPEAAGLDVFSLVATLAGASAALVLYHMFFPHVRQA